MSTCSRRGGRQPSGVKAGARGPRGSLSVPPPMWKVSTKGVKAEAETKTAQLASTWPTSVLKWGEERG